MCSMLLRRDLGLLSGIDTVDCARRVRRGDSAEERVGNVLSVLGIELDPSAPSQLDGSQPPVDVRALASYLSKLYRNFADHCGVPH